MLGAEVRSGGASRVFADGPDDVRSLEEAPAFELARPVSDVRVSEDLVERSTGVVLTDHVRRELILPGTAREHAGEGIAPEGPPCHTSDCILAA